jgi:hypothetical protein
MERASIPEVQFCSWRSATICKCALKKTEAASRLLRRREVTSAKSRGPSLLSLCLGLPGPLLCRQSGGRLEGLLRSEASLVGAARERPVAQLLTEAVPMSLRNVTRRPTAHNSIPNVAIHPTTVKRGPEDELPHRLPVCGHHTGHQRRSHYPIKDCRPKKCADGANAHEI